MSTPKLSIATSAYRESVPAVSDSSSPSPDPLLVTSPDQSSIQSVSEEVIEQARFLFSSLDLGVVPETEPCVTSTTLRVDKTLLAMSYINFSVKHRLLVAQGWCSFSDFCQFVADHQFLGFHIVPNRNRVREAYIRLRGSAPFSSTARFPDDFFVALGGPLRSYFEQLLCALDLPDRALERSGQNDFGINSLSDAKRTYDVAFQRLATISVEFDINKLAAQGVYCRETFESTFALEWRE